MFQDGPIDGYLHIIVSQGKGKVEEDRHLIENGKEDGEGTPECEMDQREEENGVPLACHQLH